MKLRRLVGILKDKAAVSRAVANSQFASLHVAILRATSHEEAPPNEKHVAAILAAGGCSSRLRASRCVAELMERLTKTRNWAVALKCLILVHRILREGSFIFQDQLSLYPFRGGRNYLNLSNFRDPSSAVTWEVSNWIRSYATYMDQWLSTCRVLGAFFGRSLEPCMATGLPNAELATELAALRDLLAAACECCQPLAPGNSVVLGALGVVLADTWELQEEVLHRLEEVRERMVGLSPGEAVEFLPVVEALAAQEDIFGGLLRVDLAGIGCLQATVRAKGLSAKVRDSLRAVSEFKPLVTRIKLGWSRDNFSQSARFVRDSANGFHSGSARSQGVILERVASDHWIYDGNESLI
ncbi:hypothetical protein SUGI_1006950 [Cryptomeria japonica]|nr:hypothetical protein SUGI_1006950 [Cryptomeria japonica]